MRIAITGTAGFIGSHLVQIFQKTAFSGGWDEIHEHRYSPEEPEADLCSPMNVRYWLGDDSQRYDAVIHCAGIVGREAGETDPCNTVRVNVGLTGILARESARRNTPFAYISSSEIYEPHNLYGLSKVWGEIITNLYHPSPLILRLSMPYGPGHFPGTGRAALTNFIWLAMHDEPLIVHRNSKRSWCWVEDTAEAIALIVRHGETGFWNVGRNDNLRTMETVAQTVIQVLGSRSEIKLVDPPAGITPVKELSFDKLEWLGWKPRVDLAEGIRRTAAWLEPYRGSHFFA